MTSSAEPKRPIFWQARNDEPDLRSVADRSSNQEGLIAAKCCRHAVHLLFLSYSDCRHQ